MRLLLDCCNKWCVMLNHYDLASLWFGLKSLVISWTTEVIWAQVWEFDRFGDCFWTYALIIWTIPWHLDHLIWSLDKETTIRGCWPSQNRHGWFPTGLGKFFKCKIGLYHCVPLVELIERHTPSRLIKNVILDSDTVSKAKLWLLIFIKPFIEKRYMYMFMKVFFKTNLFMWFWHFQTQQLKSYS
jgi:hypothetical protein